MNEIENATAEIATVDVCLIRSDANGDSVPLVDVLTVPADVADGEPHEAVNRVFELLTRVAADLIATPEGRTLTEGGPVHPVHVLNAPPEFLARYGISTKPVDTALTLEIDATEELAHPNDD